MLWYPANAARRTLWCTVCTGCDWTRVASAVACTVAMHPHEEVHCRAAWQQHLELVADILLSTYSCWQTDCYNSPSTTARAHGLACTVSHSRRGDAVGGSAADERSKSSHTDERCMVSMDNCSWISTPRFGTTVDDFGAVNLQRLVGFIELG